LPNSRGLELQNQNRLAFSLGTLEENARAIALTIELVGKDGQVARLPLSHFGPIQNALKTQLRKAAWLEGAAEVGSVEQVLQSYELPLADFVQTNPQFSPASLSQIRFSFERATAGSVFLDNLGFYAR
jgi:hypothetical protein